VIAEDLQDLAGLREQGDRRGTVVLRAVALIGSGDQP
jgi:hypothetical protein